MHAFRLSLLSACAVAVLAACASSPIQWQKADVSEHDTDSALSECKYQMGLNKIKKDAQEELVSQCMQGKGFRPQTR